MKMSVRIPFTIAFGKQPDNYISREPVSNEIIDCFSSADPFTQTYILTGVRGMGKTVMMSSISSLFREKKDWIVIDLNPSRNLLDALGANLYSNIEKEKDQLDEINPTAFGVSLLGIRKKDNPVFDIELFISDLLEKAKKQNKRILITIDEVSNTNNIKEFTLAFQSMVRRSYPVFLLMTGLYQNIRQLRNNKVLTFLYRAPNIPLKQLEMSQIQNSYRSILGVDDATAKSMAALTRGYPFAYQVLGYLYSRSKNRELPDLMDDYDRYLRDYVYEKIWQEASGKDRELLKIIAGFDGPQINTADIIRAGEMNNSTYSVYRERLMDKGLIESTRYGTIRFVLPRFREFIMRTAAQEEYFE